MIIHPVGGPQKPAITWDFDADMEAGNMSEWNVVNGAITATAASKKNGSYGAAAVISGTLANSQFDFGAATKTAHTVEFWFDPNSADVSTECNIMTLVGATTYFRIRLLYSGGVYKMRIAVTNDAVSLTYSGYTAITDDWHLIKGVWKAASAPGANDGYGLLFVDNNFVGEVRGVDNDASLNRYGTFGHVTSSSGGSGTLYFDDCKLADEIV